MGYKALSLADGGAHGDVYRGEDDFGRPVAIKFIRPSVGDEGFAVEQAKALARVKSANVVEVKAIQEVLDPASGTHVMAIVMEWIDGHSLEKVLRGPKLTIEQVRSYGRQIIDGMRAIHAAKVVHTDFHFGNIMIGADGAKIIDILYYKTLAATNTASRESRYQADRNALRSALANMLSHSGVSMSEVDVFNRGLTNTSTIDDIETAFEKVTDPNIAVDVQRLLAYSVQRVADPAFVEGAEYAQALSEDTPGVVIVALILEMISKGMTTEKHKKYLAALYARLNADERARIASELSGQIDATVPAGRWWPHLFMLSAFGTIGWQSLKTATKIRLENAITEDILVGRHDIHSPFNPSGSLGTWAKSFYLYFTKTGQVLDNLLTVTRVGWNGQNYVAKYFLPLLQRLATTPADEARVIERLLNAYNNDARMLKSNFAELPDKWRQQILSAADGHE